MTDRPPQAAPAWQDHNPMIAGDVDDSTWFACSCGWDATDSGLDWVEHVEAVMADGRRDAEVRGGATP